MRIGFPAVAGIAMLAFFPAQAADGFGFENEAPAVLEGKIVDLACTLKGDCPPECGGGRRQLGLLSSDGKLSAIVKGPVDFANAVPDMLALCGKDVQLDALVINDPTIRIVMVQGVRGKSSERWRKPRQFESQWETANGKSDEWYREDKAVRKVIGEDGVYGIKGLAPPPEKK